MFFSRFPGRLEVPETELNEFEEEDIAESLDYLVYSLWREEGRDEWEKALPYKVVHVSEITYLTKRSEGIEPSMIHGLECELGLKCRIQQLYGNKVRSPTRATLLYPEYPVAVLVPTSQGEVLLVGNPDFLLYYPTDDGFLLIPIEKKSGTSGNHEFSKKYSVALEQGAVYAIMLGSRYFAVQLHKPKRKGSKIYTVTHEVYKITDPASVKEEIESRVECVVRKKEEGKEEFSECKRREISEFVVPIVV